jgi:hypothetical protein
VFTALLLLGIALDLVLLRAHVWVDKGVAISFMAMWLGAWFLAEAVWDNFAAPEQWIVHQPRFPRLPAPLERTKPYWPYAAFVAGLGLGHVWWW